MPQSHCGYFAKREVGFEKEPRPLSAKAARLAAEWGKLDGALQQRAIASEGRLVEVVRSRLPGARVSQVMRGLPRGAYLAMFSGAHAEGARKARALGFPARDWHDRLGSSCHLTLRKVRRLFFARHVYWASFWSLSLT